MPKRVRVAAIVQLCFACCWLLLLLFSPFTGEYWTTRSSLLLFETVTGMGEGRFIPQEKLKRHQERFERLPKSTQHAVLEGYRKLEQEAQAPISSRLKKALYLLLYQEAPFLQAWLIAGLILPLFLLLRKEGVVGALWLLPLIATLYLVAHFLYSSPLPPSVDSKLFPTEERLRQFEDPALKEATEYARMQDAWNRYLITHWSPQEALSRSPSSSSLEEAEYQFTLARIEAKLQASSHSNRTNQQLASLSNFPQRSFLFLVLFFVWNFFFAALVQHAHVVIVRRQLSC